VSIGSDKAFAFSLGGAFQRACKDLGVGWLSPTRWRALRALLRYTGGRDLEEFNDLPDVTYDDVIDALVLAAISFNEDGKERDASLSSDNVEDSKQRSAADELLLRIALEAGLKGITAEQLRARLSISHLSTNIIVAYGRVMEECSKERPSLFYPISRLPFSKDEIRNALNEALAKVPDTDTEFIEDLRSGLIGLDGFVPDEEVSDRMKRLYDSYRQSLIKRAAQGDVEAQFMLGRCYYEGGSGFGQDYAEAEKWWRKAAQQGHAKAQALCAMMHVYGQSVKQNYPEAIECLQSAAESGQVHARILLGYCYANGKGVEQNFVEAYKWYSLAARAGASDAKAGIATLATRMTPTCR
jgi:tetratricopeptide (TPR) repeat protein